MLKIRALKGGTKASHPGRKATQAFFLLAVAAAQCFGGLEYAWHLEPLLSVSPSIGDDKSLATS